MNGKNDRDINEVVNKLRASVDGVDGEAGRLETTAHENGGADMSRFDREIAALIEKQLGDRANKSRGKKGADSAPSGSLIPDEIRLEDFVIDDISDEPIQAELPAETLAITPAVEQESVSLMDAPDLGDSRADDNDTAEAVIIVVSDEIDEPVEVDDVAVEALDAGVEEMPPAVADALAAAFAVEDGPDELPEGEVPWFEELPAKEHSEQADLQQTNDQLEPEMVVEEVEPVVETEPETVVEEVEPVVETEPEMVVEEVEPAVETEPEMVVEEVEPAVETEPEMVVEEVEPAVETEPEMVVEEVEPAVETEPEAAPTPSQTADDVQSDGWEYVGAEYSSHAQDAKIKSDYKRASVLTALRLALVSFICGVCAYMENLGAFGFKLLRPFEPTEDPAIFMLTLTVLLLTAALICFRELRDGLISLVRFDPEPHAMTSVAFLLGLIYNIVMLILRPEGLVAYNFPVTLCMVMSVAAELLCLCRERVTFDVVSAGSVRYSPVRESRTFEDRYNSRPSAQEGERVRRRVYSAVASYFTDGYFHRTHSKKRGIYILNFMLLPALAVGVVECVIAASMGDGVIGAMSVLMATVLMMLPAPLLICLTLPPLVSSIALKKKGCAIVGDSSVDEYSHPKLLVFEDSAMFPAERIGTKGIKLYDGFELYDVLIKTGSLFAFIGGPLGEVFKTESARYHRINDVELVRVRRGGVEARLEGKTTILAGNHDFIAHYGVYPPTSPRDRQLISEGVVSVIFIVIDGCPAARLYADYRTNEQFENALTMIEKDRDAAAIRTSDPGIDEVMISRKRTLPNYELSVIRPGYAREGAPSETVDSGAVALDDPVALIGVMNECHKLKNKRRRGLLLYFCAFLVSVIIATLTVTLRLGAYAVSGTVALYMLAWVLPAVMMSFGGRRG